MANLVRNFIKGRMNKSVDERLVPNGEYIDAQNIRMGSTEDSEIGAVENTKGNTQLTTLVYPPTGTALSDNATCLGAYSDGANETMYWFVHDPAFTEGATGKLDLIVSYNMRSDLLTYHVVSIKDATDPTNSDTTLNFDPQYLVTGIDLVDDLLFFTDDFNPPRRINVTTAYPQPSAANVDSGVLGDDILVIKRPPIEAPTVVTSNDGSQNNYMEDRLICFGYRYRYEESEYSATSQFTSPAFVSKPFNFTPESYLNDGMENAINTCQVTVRTGSSLVKGIDILFKEMDDNIIRVIEKVDKADSALTDNSDYTITFNKSKIFTILPESEILRLYDNVPRLSKAQTMMGNRLVYGNYLEGYDLIDENNQPIKFGYDVFHVKRPAAPVVVDVSDNSSTTYNITPNPSTPNTTVLVDFEEFNMNLGDTFTLEITMGNDTPSGGIFLPVNVNVPDSATPVSTIVMSYTLTEDFDSVSEMVASTSFLEAVGTAGTIETNPVNFPFADQTIWTNAWNGVLQQAATGGTPASMPLAGSGIDALAEPAEIVASTAATFTIAFPMPEYTGTSDNYYEQIQIDTISIFVETANVQRSLHSNRSYEVGIVYMDGFGRSSTALVNAGNDIQIACVDSIFSNRIQVQVPAAMRAPYWADRYKFVIKPDRENYETIYSDYTVIPLDGNSYFLLEGENAAKVEEGDRYVVKRDADGPTTVCSYATVLEKKTYIEDEIETGSLPGTYMKILPDFNAVISGTNLFLGRQSAGTNGGDDQRTENGADSPGEYPVLVYTGFENSATTLPTIPSGTRIRLEMNFTRVGRGDASCESRFMEFELNFVAPQDYDYIFQWFDDPASGARAAIEAQIGQAGDPDETLPTNQTYDTTVTGGPLFDMSTNSDTNQIRFYANNTTNPSTIQFVAIGTNKCGGGFGSGSSPNRRSRINATWTIIKSNSTFVFETEPQDALPDLWYESSQSYPIVTDPDDVRRYRGNTQNQTATLPAIVDTAFFNCITYGNGVESYKVRDSVTGKPITLGNRVTTTSDQDYREIRRFADLTYSGVYNDETNINKLNEFNLGLLNFKPLEDSYGPVEKLFGRRTDILTLQEDKISYVLAGKNLLTDSTGESVVTSVPEVLGTQVARTEDFGISNNPESFAEWGPHKFFTDAKRGSVIHLYGDGQREQLTVISENGMRSWFRDEFIANFNTQKLGGYDPYMNEYVLASNDTFLPGQEDCIECNTIQTFLLTPAQQTFCVNLGNLVGPVSIDYVVIDPVPDDASATITTTYSGSSVSTGPITNVSEPPVPDVNKNSITENTLTIDLDYVAGVTGRDFVIQVQVKCPEVSTLEIRLITLSRPEYQNQTIHSEYQWGTTDGFVSPLSSTPVAFNYGAGAPIVSSWQEISAPQGGNLGPTDGSTVTMVYNRITPDNYTLRASDRFRYLRSATKYLETDIATILSNSLPVGGITPTGAQPRYTGDFLMPPGTDEYLYLIWDYSNA